MTIPQIISLIILVIIVYLSIKRGNDIFSPAKVFLVVWSSCIFLAEFKFSGYQHQWSLYGWFVLLLGLISFLAGIFIAYVIFINQPLYSINIIRNKSRVLHESSIKKLYYATIILFVLYVISFATEVLVEGYVPLFSLRYDIARVEFGLFGFHLIVNFQLIIMFLNIEYIILAKGHKQEKIIMWIIFFITLISFTLLLQRFNFFLGAVMTLALLYYSSRVVKIRNVLAIAFIFFGLLSIIQTIRLSQYVSQYIYVTSKMKFSRDYAIFSEPYMYISMNLENMSRAVDQLENHTYGIFTFDWVYAFSGLKHWVAEYFSINPGAFLISGYTTFPFHWYYYLDFGLTGVMVFTLLTGFFIGVCYYKMRMTAQISWVILYSICVALMVISFFTNPLMMLTFISNFFILWLIHYFFVRQNSLLNI
jgi:oligosaccharide repeat unit polymerase